MTKKPYTPLYHGRFWRTNPFKQIVRDVRCCYQRIKYGYCDYDVWSITDWFLSVMPNMLEELKETTHSFPVSEGTEEEQIKKWNDTLNQMAFLLREANEDTCKKKNLYEEQWFKVQEDFVNKYGIFGEKLRSEEELEEEKKSGKRRWHHPSELPENKELFNNYMQEERNLMKYRDECKNKGFEMLSKWFWDLWD